MRRIAGRLQAGHLRTGGRADGQAGGRAGGQAGGRAGRQAGRQAGRRASWCSARDTHPSAHPPTNPPTLLILTQQLHVGADLQPGHQVRRIDVPAAVVGGWVGGSWSCGCVGGVGGGGQAGHAWGREGRTGRASAPEDSPHAARLPGSQLTMHRQLACNAGHACETLTKERSRGACCQLRPVAAGARCVRRGRKGRGRWGSNLVG